MSIIHSRSKKGVILFTLAILLTAFSLFAGAKFQEGETRKKSIVSYLPNGGVGEAYTREIPLEGALKMSEGVGFASPKKLNCVLLGWSEEALGIIESPDQLTDKTIFSIGENITVDNRKDLTLYAVWAADIGGPSCGIDRKPDYLQYRVIYDFDAPWDSENPPVMPEDPRFYNPDGIAYILYTPKPERKGYVFEGWAREKGGNLSYAQGLPPVYINVSQNTTLYAVWLKTWTVNYDFNAGDDTLDQPLPMDTRGPYLDGAEVRALFPPNDPKRKGFLFKGWTDEPNGGEIFLTRDPSGGGSATFTIFKDTTLYAKWELAQHSAIFHKNFTDDEFNIGEAPEAIVTTYGAVINLPMSPAMERRGFRFAGWADKKEVVEGTKIYSADDNSAFTMEDEDKHFYAVWEPIPELTYNGNGNDAGNVPESAYYDCGVVVTPSEGQGLAKDHAVFIGWSKTETIHPISATDQLNGIGFMTTEQSFSMPETNLTLYAVWANDQNLDGTPDYEQFSITYHANNGEGVPIDVSLYNSGEYAQIQNPEQLKRAGFICIGFSEKPDPVDVYRAEDVPGILFTGDMSYPIQNRNVDLYAVWAVDAGGYELGSDGTPDYFQFAVTYRLNLPEDAGNDYTPIDERLYSPEQDVIVLFEPVFIPYGYRFLGWAEKSDAKKPDYFPEETDRDRFRIHRNTTLYGVWELVKIKVYFHTNGAEGDELLQGGAILVPEGRFFELPDKAGMIYPNAVFLGWSLVHIDLVDTLDKMPNDLYQPAQDFQVKSEDVDFYAIWAVDVMDGNGNELPDGIPDFLQHQITYKIDGLPDEAIPVDPKKYKAGDKAILARVPAALDRSLLFLGWSREAGSQTAEYQPGATIKMPNEDLVFYGVFRPRGIFHVDYVSDDDESTNLPFDEKEYYEGSEAIVLFTPVPQREGYKFAGWLQRNEDQIIKYTADGINRIVMTADAELYAIWEPPQKETPTATFMPTRLVKPTKTHKIAASDGIIFPSPSMSADASEIFAPTPAMTKTETPPVATARATSQPKDLPSTSATPTMNAPATLISTLPIPTGAPMFWRNGMSNRLIPNSGFAGNKPEPLAPQPDAMAYETLPFAFEIPSLDVYAAITMIPKTEKSWAADWLDYRIGFLEGGYAPGEGMCFLTAPNRLNSLEDGPFLLIGWLKIGDRIFIQRNNGELMQFRVYKNQLFAPDQFGEAAILTMGRRNPIVLMTNEDEAINGGYLHRRVVFAEQIDMADIDANQE